MALQPWAVVPNLDVVKTHLRIDGDAEDQLLEALVHAATQESEDYCRRYWVRRQAVEDRVGDGTPILFLRRSPVVQVSNVLLDGEPATDFELLPGFEALQRPGGWPEGSKIRVTYEAGYVDTAAEVAEHLPTVLLWVLERVSRAYEQRSQGLRMETLTGAGQFMWDPVGYRLLDALRAGGV